MTPTSKKYIVKLSDDDLKRLDKILRQKNTSETVANRIRILKDMDANHPPVKTYKQCASDHGISEPTITNAVRKFVNEGLDATIKLKRSVNSDNAQRKVDGRVEAKLLEVACGPVPKGHSRWTLRLLEAQMKIILDEPISREAIRRTLKKQLRPHRSDYWCLPKKEDPEFIACMEDVLDVYKFPYDPKVPVVCMNEKPYQLLGEVRDSWAMRPGDNKKVDSEYVRKGTCSIFAFVEPLGGRHHTSVREHRTAVDWAEEIKYMVDEMYPEAEKIILVMDNLNTHKPSSLYKTFNPEEARRIIKKLEIHYTPKHGSWLDIAEIELNMMTRQCLSRRIPDIETLRKELSAWESKRNNSYALVNWQFRTSDARIKLASLYPKL
ncbi:IS630 family transposase [Lactobacillus nasalidis]|uniref:IS630 family transposase n=2 Tax=Lactobacillus TaxID=1578 RepID=A0ABQ3W6I7_9LACO|nr:IS630 family transposase [Lactobacillus nasalidis]GHV97577.1 IS630 family transposase [Lactobacillus nasalidis]GHV99228.1 IS630 family transposase [Lactobacillus nasalidis]GHW00945.1 IS630 family transposase [Lactobacillus nasalidis]